MYGRWYSDTGAWFRGGPEAQSSCCAFGKGVRTGSGNGRGGEPDSTYKVKQLRSLVGKTVPLWQLDGFRGKG